MQNDLQNLAGKIGELESEADEHRWVSQCFRGVSDAEILHAAWF